MKEKNLRIEEKLKAVRKALGTPVIFRVGMKDTNTYDLIDMQVFPEEEEEQPDEKIWYVG